MNATMDGVIGATMVEHGRPRMGSWSTMRDHDRVHRRVHERHRGCDHGQPWSSMGDHGRVHG